MYDELVKNLRGLSRYTAGTVTGLCEQAADAIEELSKPRWMPLPEPPKEEV